MKPPSAARATTGSARATPLEAIIRKGRFALFFMCSLFLLFEQHRRHRTTGQAMPLRRYAEKTLINPLPPQIIRRLAGSYCWRHLKDIAPKLPTYLVSFPAEHNIAQTYLCANRTLARPWKTNRQNRKPRTTGSRNSSRTTAKLPGKNFTTYNPSCALYRRHARQAAGQRKPRHPAAWIRRQDRPGARARSRGRSGKTPAWRWRRWRRGWRRP
ncbi:hypothetical protein D3C84_434010 [compost metagenome]